MKKRKGEEEKEQQKNGKCKVQADTRHQVRESSSVGDDIPDGHSTSSSSTGSDSDTMTGEEPGRNRPQRRSQLTARFREDIDDADGVLCEICHSTEPEGLASGTVFWIDCDKCGVWVQIIVSSRKIMSVANIRAVIVQQMVIELLLFLMMCWSVSLCRSIV